MFERQSIAICSELISINVNSAHFYHVFDKPILLIMNTQSHITDCWTVRFVIGAELDYEWAELDYKWAELVLNISPYWLVGQHQDVMQSGVPAWWWQICFKFSKRPIQVDCQDFLYSSLMKAVSTTCSMSAFSICIKSGFDASSWKQ